MSQFILKLNFIGLVIAFLFSFSTFCKAESFSLRLTEQALEIGQRTYQVSIPHGYVLEIVSTDLQQPRMMTFTQDKELLIGSRSGKIYRLQQPYQQVEILADMGGGYPHSVAVRGNQLLVAKNKGVYQTSYQANDPPIKKNKFELLATLPSGGGHSSRTIGVGPDQRIYVSLGISGNCSNQYIDDSYNEKQRRGGIMVLNETTNPPSWKPYATGFRNPIGFDWQPDSSMLYATNNGPDHWGYELPPEYFSRAEAGSFHGMPWFQFDGDEVRRDNCIKIKPPRTDVTLPEITFPARNAPMGVAFISSGRLQNDAIVALHGSWATLPDGGHGGDPATRRRPKLVLVRFENQQAQRIDDLITGFQLNDGTRWARPVDVAFGPDKAIYFTSDSGVNGLFRLRYLNEEDKN